LTPILEDPWLTVYGGDNREVMRALPDESVQCVVTSPPYWGLRDYGTDSWDGGDPACDHRGPPRMSESTNIGRSRGKDARLLLHAPSRTEATVPFKDTCGKCGAIRQDRQLGLEQTPEEYVAAMVDVFREVRRVLRKDGTLWLNLGDSYAASGLKPKDLVGIPWRVAFALQADGWYLRSDIIWAKPNPMPESVTDRPTKSHEYLFLLSRSERYLYDADAIREAPADRTLEQIEIDRRAGLYEQRGDGGIRGTNEHKPAGLNAVRNSRFRTMLHPAGRNRRSVWTIATKPYPGAHFATFPEALVEPCILAGTSEAGACETCGAPLERVVEKRAPMDLSGVQHRGVGDDPAATLRNDVGGVVDRSNGQEWARWKASHPDVTLGFRPACAHDGDPVPCVVLDPFAGTGTVGAVAQRLSRRALLIDLNPDYLRQCLTRNAAMPLGLVAPR
jgi:DNA modification methylase